MSRSYKKTPILKDNKNGRKQDKRLANKKVRNTKEVPSGKHYRKVYNPWDIYDYVSYCTFEDFLHFRDDRQSKEELYIEWCKFYKYK